MDGYAVGSFPYETWAREVQELLSARGISSELSYAGPRAFQVLVEDKDGDRAGEVLSDLGYLACPVAGGASMSGVLEWRGQDALDEDDFRSLIKWFVEQNVEQLANQHAAEAWSTPGDELIDKYGEVIIVSIFNGAIAVNGDLVETIPLSTEGYVDVDDGGNVPVAEEHVDVETLTRMTVDQVRRLRGKGFERVVKEVVKEMYGDYIEVPVSVSGATYVRAKKVRGKANGNKR